MHVHEQGTGLYLQHPERSNYVENAFLSPHLLQDYPSAVHRKGGALDNCFGFVDGCPAHRPA